MGRNWASTRRGLQGEAPACCTAPTPTCCKTEDGLISNTHSVSAGLDYAAVGPEHAALYRQGRVEYTHVSDEEALEAARLLAHKEGIIPALESAHALAEVIKRAPKMRRDEMVVVNLSGRGDKDLGIFQSRGVL